MSKNTIQSIIDKLNVSEIIGEYLDISKKGKNYLAICPFHDDNNPSLSISNEKKIFKCFVCGVGGNIINFVVDYEKISFNGALKKLAKKAGIELKENVINKPLYNDFEQKIVNVLNEAKNFFQYNLTTNEGNEAIKYLSSRNIFTSDIERYAIGYAPNKGLVKFLIAKGFDKSTLINASLMNEYEKDFFKNRIMFAILNEHGDVIGFSGRIMKGEGPKYINSIESRVFKKSQIFYNINNAIEHIKKIKEVYINEGFMDVIALDKIGVTNTLAVMGTFLTMKHIAFLKNKQVNLMFDFDAAGINATFKSIKLLLENNIKIKIIYNNIANDADEILQKHGKDKLKEILNNKKNVFDFIYALINKKHNPNDPDSIKKFLQEFGQYLKYGDKIEKEFYISKASQEYKITPEIISSYVPNYLIQKEFIKSNQTNDTTLSQHNPTNYSYILIKSLVKNPSLLKVYKHDEVHFFDSVAMNIGKYLALGKKDRKKEEKFKDDWNKINDQIPDSAIINNKEELEEVIEYINRESKKQILRRTREKIKESKSETEKKAYLSSIQKFQRKKGRK